MGQRVQGDLPIPTDLIMEDDLLTRYGVWAMDRYKKETCASIEGRYKCPDDREPKTVFMRDFDAMEVQRAIQRVPFRERVVLFAWYVPKRIPFERQIKIMRVDRRTAIERRNHGLRMFSNIFEKNKKKFN